MRVFLQALIAQILLNPYIFWRGYQAIPPSKKWRVPYILLFILEWHLYFTGFFFHGSLPNGLLTSLLLICNTWYVASIYLTMGLLLLELVRLAVRRWHRCPETIRRHWPEMKLALFFIFLAAVAGLMVKAHYNVAHPVVKHVHLHIPKVVAGRDSLTIAMLSDLHFGETIGKDYARRYVALCNGQHPDIIVLTGDIIDHESLIAEREHIEDDLRQLHAPLGTYLILGNHEYRANRHAKLRWLKKTGGVLLVDSVAMPDSTFYLIGRDDAINPHRATLRTLMEKTDPAKPVIVLDHQPEAFNETRMNHPDLTLHGHTHNGQLWPYSLLLKLVFECPYGYYRTGNTQFYISSGIGCAGPPYRVGTCSELVMLHITFDKKQL
ncbi:MAG: metallophosphoesterase [Tannerella sp.]|jgi:predicted MPP superfamily phosphohydrolase|nr:metallophosphoesterase [Tannerella sp.]